MPKPTLLLADDINTLFGKVSPPPGMDKFANDPAAGLGRLFSVSLQVILIIAGLMVLIYMTWGALDWIGSGGEKEKISKAQNKITNAIIGLLLVIFAFVIFGFITGEILGNKIIERDSNGWHFQIPTL